MVQQKQQKQLHQLRVLAKAGKQGGFTLLLLYPPCFPPSFHYGTDLRHSPRGGPPSLFIVPPATLSYRPALFHRALLYSMCVRAGSTVARGRISPSGALFHRCRQRNAAARRPKLRLRHLRMRNSSQRSQRRPA